MSRDAYLMSDPSLRTTLDGRNVDELKKLVALLPNTATKPARKGELIGVLERFLIGGGALQLWGQLKQLEQSAVAEAVHSEEGAFDAGAFGAKYGALPGFETEEKDRWSRNPTRLSLFIYRNPQGPPSIPPDLREKLRTFVPKPAAAKLNSLEQIPETPVRQWTSSYFDEKKRTRIYEQHDAPLMLRLTEQTAFQDLRIVLRSIDQEKISVSLKSLLPSKATTALLNDLLGGHDFFELTEKVNSWDPAIGPVKAFSWPLLVQAAKFAALRHDKLLLTKTGRAALEVPPANTLREVWNAWVTRGIIDEFSRIDAIKGQKGKGSRSFTAPEDRRRTIKCALAECPVGRWVEIGEFSRYMRAAGFQFEVTRNPWSLYISDPQYGSLGYDGYGGWNVLQERYLVCLLMEYARPLVWSISLMNIRRARAAIFTGNGGRTTSSSSAGTMACDTFD